MKLDYSYALDFKSYDHPVIIPTRGLIGIEALKMPIITFKRSYLIHLQVKIQPSSCLSRVALFSS